MHADILALAVLQFNQSIKTREAQASLGTPTDAFAATADHRRLSSATLSNDDIDWPVVLQLPYLNLCASFIGLKHFRPLRANLKWQ